MAAATVAGLGPRAMEEKKFEYFSSINSMAKKIMQEREKIKSQHGPTWQQMTPQEQDSAIDRCLMDPQVRARYAMHRVERQEVVCYPKMLLHTGQKVVHFGEEDITWQDEHSAPFSWETKSQLEFSLTSGSDSALSASQSDPKAAKAPHSNQLGKSALGTKATVSESRRPEEESAFWKISAERSRLEGEKADFQSLTPSQIKSLEKGEKPLPSYLRQVSSGDVGVQRSRAGGPAGAPSCSGQAHQAAGPQTSGPAAARGGQRHAGLHLHRPESSAASERLAVGGRVGAISEHPALRQQHAGRRLLLQPHVQVPEALAESGEGEGGGAFAQQPHLFTVQHEQQHPEERI